MAEDSAISCMSHLWSRKALSGVFDVSIRTTLMWSVSKVLRPMLCMFTEDLHDVEFMASAPYPSPAGHHNDALQALADATVPDPFHLRPPYAPLGPGDESILACITAIRELQSAGKVRNVGMAAFPLPTLLRLCLMVLHQTGKPLDIIQTYCHNTLQNTVLTAYLSAFTNLAQVRQVVNASPLSMGMLTMSGGPEWHPYRDEARLDSAMNEARAICATASMALEELSVDFGYQELKQSDGRIVPCVIGCKNLDELHQTLAGRLRVYDGDMWTATRRNDDR